jgi:hypothetical protein
MNKVVKLRAFFQSIVLYCFIVSLCSTGFLTPCISPQNVSSTRFGSYLPIEGVDLLKITSKIENVSNSLSLYSSLLLKIHLNDLGVFQEAVESFFYNTSSQYIFYAANGITRFLQTDIIFPFHYFW